jgi:F420-dependent oxidoreductase-like protein
MRFGAFVPQGWRLDLVGIDQAEHWNTMVDIAKLIESSGYESLWVYDHFHTVPIPTQEVTYEAWTLMSALAAVTDTVRLGQMCTCNSYRPPSYLAKVAASIDVISAGRVEMGIGAGWYEHEYKGYGYPFDKPSVRIGRLREAVEIMQAMWTEDEVTYDGKHYQLDGAICQPKPVQDPHIPLWIAGGGEQLTLNVAARHAQYTNFGNSLDEFIHKSNVLEGHCGDVGREFGGIVRTSNFNVICADTQSEVDEKLAWVTSHLEPFVGVERADKIVQSNFVDGGTAGTPEQIVETLSSWRDAGMEYAIAYFPDAAYDTSGLELFARTVIQEMS